MSITSASLRPSRVCLIFSCLANAERTWRKFQPSTRVRLYCTTSPRRQTSNRSRTVIPGVMRYSPVCSGTPAMLKRQYRRNQKASSSRP
ncbi:hypothetical protein D3C72_1893770 [compost metagenome]